MVCKVMHTWKLIAASIQTLMKGLLHADKPTDACRELTICMPILQSINHDTAIPCRLGRPPRASAPIEFEEREELLQGMTMTPPPHMFEELSDDQAAATPADQQEEA